jgi:hypothetical protein
VADIVQPNRARTSRFGQSVPEPRETVGRVLTVDAGENPATGKRQQVRRRYATEKQARDALAEITDQASKGTFVARKAVTVDELCED